jgi:hypothetical protein
VVPNNSRVLKNILVVNALIIFGLKTYGIVFIFKVVLIIEFILEILLLINRIILEPTRPLY